MEYMIGAIIVMGIIAFAAMKLRKEKKWVTDPDAPIKVGSLVDYQGVKFKVMAILGGGAIEIRDYSTMTQSLVVFESEVAAYVLK